MNSPLPLVPESFGNLVLKGFVEIDAPEQAISWLPQTIGWLVLVLVLIVLALYRGYRYYQYWFNNRYRKSAVAALNKLTEQGLPPDAFIQQVAIILKATALHLFMIFQIFEGFYPN